MFNPACLAPETRKYPSLGRPRRRAAEFDSEAEILTGGWPKFKRSTVFPRYVLQGSAVLFCDEAHVLLGNPTNQVTDTGPTSLPATHPDIPAPTDSHGN